MKTSICKESLALLLKYIETETSFEAASVEIDSNGWVTALRDPDKTYRASETMRILVGPVDDLLALAKGGAE